MTNGVLEVLSDRRVCSLLQEGKPERLAALKGVSFSQVAEVAKEAGYSNPEVVILAYKSIKAATKFYHKGGGISG